ncbi:MAG: NADP-dependent glyceraldehyde-3-phosphate dehydrogenase [Spirochaetaceae bacterium]|nr:MAG: NADP-dependent glyceraldehyde-3-phosphate dehydrogenase [Spirochaetaceae bacterium]
MSIKDTIMSIFPEESSLPSEVQLKEINQRQYLAGGRLREWKGPVQDVLSPVCLKTKNGAARKKIGSYPLCTEKESEEVLQAAVAAWDCGRGEWPCMGLEKRIRCIEDFAFKMKEKREIVVNLIMWEIGKTRKDSEKEFDRTLQYIYDTIEAVKDMDRASSRFSIEEGIIAQIRRAPLGVVLCMGPYNYPLNETYTTLIPALIMGNTAIFKPPKYGVLLHQPLLEAFAECFPKGVVNTIYGEGTKIIPPIMASGKVDVLAFIGSSKVADILKHQHPQPHRLRSILGLGAKNAGIVLADADMELAVKECVTGSLSYNGQRCTALKILFVHKSRIDEFLTMFTAELLKLKCGMPWDADVALTPLPEGGKCEYLDSVVKDATALGAKIINADGGVFNNTFFYPALLYPVNEKMRAYHEEQFGPVIPVASFENIEEPLNYVVDSAFGQQLSIFGTDPDCISDLIDPLVNQVCRLNINSQCQRGPDVFPFTGRKDSAEGTLSVSDALRCFAIRTLVAAKSSDVNKKILTGMVRERKSSFLSTDFIF